MVVRPDRWSEWLLERRDAGDDSQRAVALEHLLPIRDRVLAGAEPLAGATVLDVGAGDGLVALEALDRVGAEGTVIFADVSPALLEACRKAVEHRQLPSEARFLLTRAEHLAEIADEAVDVITTRSVLIYVADKPAAFAAFHRVLRPGGRISLFEPINALMYPEPPDRFCGYDVSAMEDLSNKVKAAFDRREGEAAATMMDFDDRDLVDMAAAAGFERVHLESHIELKSGSPMRAINVAALLDSAPNPLAPTVREALVEVLSDEEQDRFVAHLARQVETAEPRGRHAVAYLTARKPG